ncbi:EVE domain-containing protein [Salinivibrio proteolyticus]|uniref:EVE domain-containing protein n=1 Tax=Salinivibrio proteolyticus TaxID=334715 RepID=A0ABY7LF46_9GAMM|nr:EVE domain-containing protein [Salinivibrio proteolyticus]WBA14827.1 EVE domain-containing protein [Salinivibrio proteolyticus]
MGYWLFKTEPDTFSIDTLKQQKVSCWEGVRNYQARNMLRDEVKVGDQVLIYHSSCKHVGVAGVATVTRECYPDHTQFEPDSGYFDPKATPEAPRWFMVDVAYQRHLPLITLAQMKQNPALAEMPLVKKGNRLSVMPVTAAQWQAILTMAGESCIVR